jgi:hypothetical protein
MNNQLHEFLIAEKRADLERELAYNKLIDEAENAKAHRQGFIANILHALGIWMMHIGERLHERYHVAAHLPKVQE